MLKVGRAAARNTGDGCCRLFPRRPSGLLRRSEAHKGHGVGVMSAQGQRTQMYRFLAHLALPHTGDRVYG